MCSNGPLYFVVNVFCGALGSGVEAGGSSSQLAAERWDAMDGLSSIRPEIEAFISRENRSHADKWLQQVNWAENERTLTLYIQKPPSPVGDATDTTRVRVP